MIMEARVAPLDLNSTISHLKSLNRGVPPNGASVCVENVNDELTCIGYVQIAPIVKFFTHIHLLISLVILIFKNEPYRNTGNQTKHAVLYKIVLPSGIVLPNSALQENMCFRYRLLGMCMSGMWETTSYSRNNQGICVQGTSWHL